MAWMGSLFREDPVADAQAAWLEEAQRREIRDMLLRSGIVSAIEAPPGEYYPDASLVTEWGGRGEEGEWSPGPSEPAGEWEETDSPLLLKRRNKDGSWSFSTAIPEDLFGSEIAGPGVPIQHRYRRY